MWCPGMGCHIQYKEKYKKRIYNLQTMNQSSNERINCMRKRYYKYDLKEWTIVKYRKNAREKLLQVENRTVSPLGVQMDLF